MTYEEAEIENAKRKYINWLCDGCENKMITVYEDDTPASRTPYGWWAGTCTALNVGISSSELPPKKCPLLSKT